ncbi:hypothetical protein RIF29_39632 [Crotalaria pallida]|uniref:Uncharacterized protein n=1 Tax=Crotalaria pallida TaxID=3830 RepID=A0AAN9E259_CROPI
MTTKQPEKDIQCEHATPTTPHVMSNLTGSKASQSAGSNVNDITTESLLQAIQDLSNRLGSLEKENHELKTQLIAEQLQSTTKEFLPNLFPQKRETNNNISGAKINSIVSEVIKKSKDPIAQISQREGSTKERAIAVDDIVGFTRFADEVPQVVIDEYTTPRTGTRTKTSKGKERGDGSFFRMLQNHQILDQIGLGFKLGWDQDHRSQVNCPPIIPVNSTFGSQAREETPNGRVKQIQTIQSLHQWFTQSSPESSHKHFPYRNVFPKQRAKMLFDIKAEMNLDHIQQKLAYYVFGCNLDDRLFYSCAGYTLSVKLKKRQLDHGFYLPRLRYIFVPVLDDTHWYLVVATLLEHKVCWLDTNSVTGLGMSRLSDIEKLCQGIPNCRNSILSALYVLEWLSMENWFRSWPYGNVVTDICNFIDEDVARMNAMLTLLMSNINEEASKIQKLAERVFANLKHRKSPSYVAN